ncbi:MAG: hypothetical protein HQL11_06270, partial [Candidatus Omnitrophica bacterium]|nr:hypothetical protein [Candidatus Omnitrophota bacterium]
MLVLPHENVALKETHKGTNGKLIIHIQDPHANYSGQMNIAGALDFLLGKYDLPLVLVEGSAKDGTLTQLRELGSLEDWRRYSKKFLAQNIIDGVEYLNLTTDHPMKILGIEFKDLYDANVDAYAVLRKGRRDALEHLHRIRSALQRVKDKLYPVPILEFEQNTRPSNAPGETNLQEKIGRLFDLSEGLRLQTDRYTELHKLRQLRDAERSIDFEKVNEDRRALLAAIGGGGAGREAENLISEMNRFSTNPLSQGAALADLLGSAEKRGIHPSQFKALSLYGEYLGRFAGFSMEKVLLDLGSLEEDVYRACLPDEDSQKIRAIDRYLALLEKSLQIELSTDEYETLQASEGDFLTLSWEAFLNAKLEDQGYFEDLVHYEPVLDQMRPLVERFYALVKDRDDGFLENTAHWMNRFNSAAAVLVAGGYHTRNLTKLWRREGYSYVVLTPVVNSETDREQYEEALLLRRFQNAGEGGQTERTNEDSARTLDVLTGNSLPEIELRPLAEVVPADRRSEALQTIRSLCRKENRLSPHARADIAGAKLAAEEDPGELDTDSPGIMAEIELMGSEDQAVRAAAVQRVTQHYIPAMKRLGRLRYYQARFFSEEIAGVAFHTYGIEDFENTAVMAGIMVIQKFKATRSNATGLRPRLQQKVAAMLYHDMLYGWSENLADLEGFFDVLLRVIKTPEAGLQGSFEISREGVTAHLDKAFPQYVIIAENLRHMEAGQYLSEPRDHEAVKALPAPKEQAADEDDKMTAIKRAIKE